MTRIRWKAGPASMWDGAALVSLTDFTVFRARDLPGVWRTGLRLRRSWTRMEGAVGLWLWALPLERRGGSVSVWRSEEDLLRFVRWPVHLAVMRHYRDKGSLESASWDVERFVAAEVWAEARRRLAHVA
jgi:hypothetical protein